MNIFTATEFHLVAYVIDAVSPDRAKVRLTVAYRDEDGDWFDGHDAPVLPYWHMPIDDLLGLAYQVPAIPPHWLDHVASEAIKDAVKAGAHRARGVSILAELGFAVPAPPTPKPQSRR